MNKLLTTITLLCFSVAANADIYVCDSTAIGNVGTGTSFLIDVAELQEQYILDTEAGMVSRTIFNGERQPNPELTEVECAVEGLDLVCNEKTLLRSRVQIVIGVNRYLPFAYTRVSVFGDAKVKSTVGTCTQT
jgi:hypothetical protein